MVDLSAAVTSIFVLPSEKLKLVGAVIVASGESVMTGTSVPTSVVLATPILTVVEPITPLKAPSAKVRMSFALLGGGARVAVTV